MKAFCEAKGVGHTPWDPYLVSLDMCHHMKQEYCKCPKNLIMSNIAVIILKIEQCGFTSFTMCRYVPNYAHRIAYSEDPDHTAHLGAV